MTTSVRALITALTICSTSVLGCASNERRALAESGAGQRVEPKQPSDSSEAMMLTLTSKGGLFGWSGRVDMAGLRSSIQDYTSIRKEMWIIVEVSDPGNTTSAALAAAARQLQEAVEVSVTPGSIVHVFLTIPREEDAGLSRSVREQRGTTLMLSKPPP
jgi:hypothetical protein